MNSCSVCMYLDAKVGGAPFMYEGSSYCKRHLILAMQATSSVARPPAKKKVKDAKVKDNSGGKG